jgi:hypothetical protein
MGRINNVRGLSIDHRRTMVVYSAYRGYTMEVPASVTTEDGTNVVRRWYEGGTNKGDFLEKCATDMELSASYHGITYH